jgi:GNAT superfamily N-acetyltransferase
VMKQLRPQFDADRYVEQVKRQQKASGYMLAALIENGEVRSAAGYRFSEALAWGKYLYVDDLITDENYRSHGYGQQLFDWLVTEARNRDCDVFHLDSGVQRHAAHRFYLRKGMDITSHHFQMCLN